MRRLVTFSAPRTAPPDLLLRLREIDPATELVYFGAGRWVSGRVVSNRERMRKGALILEWERGMTHPDLDALRIGELSRQGFGIVAEYKIQGEPDGRIVEDFRLRDFRFLTAGEETFRARYAESCGDTRLAQMQTAMLDRIDATAGDAWRWAFRKPVSSLVPALPGGAHVH